MLSTGPQLAPLRALPFLKPKRPALASARQGASLGRYGAPESPRPPRWPQEAPKLRTCPRAQARGRSLERKGN
eukprot:7709464-Pyramimonas_sp.AAC.1